MSEDKEILIIQNFGPIKDIKLELKKFNVLIGEQATGKSTVAKVLAVCRYFSYIVDYKILKDYEGSFVNGLRYWKIYEYLKQSTYISYENDDYKVELKQSKTELEESINKNNLVTPNYSQKSFYFPIIIPKSDKFKNLLSELKEVKKIAHINNELDWTPSENFFRTSVKKVMNNPFYFPTERGLQSIFSLGQSSIHNLANSLFDQLAKLNNITNIFGSGTYIEPLELKYKNFNGKGFVKKKFENSYYSLAEGASGYQSIIPIVLSVKYYNLIKNRRKTFIIEEPEQNLFPTAQKKLIEFLVKTVNESENQFILPTHSPYILTTLSNLIYAHKIGTIEKGKYEDKVNDIISKESWIDVKDISVYYLKNGIAENMVNEEDCTINLDTLDDASEIINTEFDKLLTIEAQND